MDYTFQKHMLSEAERTWLLEVLHSTSFDPKVAKVKLFGKLPPDFDQNSIDGRLYSNGHLTPIGLWHLDPNNALLTAMDQVIQTIRAMIVEKPGIESIEVPAVAARAGIDQQMVGRALYEFSQLGHFFSSASRHPNSTSYMSIQLADETAYDEYLRYKDLDDLLERAYIARARTASGWPSSSVFVSSSQFNDGIIENDQLLERKSIKPNTAFVLMAMDPGKPELEDVYTTIKDVCHEFSISASRADDIEHQDRITDLILGEIQTCEHLIADLSYERPNVYYEVGYAHAINKKPILYRRAGTRLHFDLSIHNVPEYKNITDFRKKLRGRLEAIMGRKPKPT